MYKHVGNERHKRIVQYYNQNPNCFIFQFIFFSSSQRSDFFFPLTAFNVFGFSSTYIFFHFSLFASFGQCFSSSFWGCKKMATFGMSE